MKDLTRFETARVIGARSLQLAFGAPALVDTDIENPIEIAKMEFEKDVIPISVKRVQKNN